MKLRIILLLNFVLVLVSSCYYDNGEALFPNADINCDTVNVNFTPVASEIIYQSCATTNCHVAGTGRVLLTNYDEIKSTIDNGLFVQRTIYAQDMPPQGPLSPCNIKKLNAWINNGALND